MCFEKNVYSAAFGCNIIYIYIKSVWYNVSFKTTVSLFFYFCLGDLVIDVHSALLWSPELYALKVPAMWAAWILLLWQADYCG